MNLIVSELTDFVVYFTHVIAGSLIFHVNVDFFVFGFNHTLQRFPSIS